MKVFEIIGMVATGGVAVLGAAYFSGGMFSSPAAPEVAETQQVTRAVSDNTVVPAISQLENIVNAALQPVDPQQELSDEQKEVIKFFEKTARNMNGDRVGTDTGEFQFDNMSIDGLNVRYFYTVNDPYASIDHAAFLDTHGELVLDNLCSDAAIATLMTDYGFAYTYTYMSSDFRLVGRIHGDADTCV